MDTEHEFDGDSFRQALERHWKHHCLCHQINWSIRLRDDGIWQIEAAPIYQEVFGGQNDGAKVWVGYEVSLSGLLAEPGVNVTDFGAMSHCEDCNTQPFVGLRGTYHGQQFVMKLSLEPDPTSEPQEILDTLKREVRAIEGEQHEG